MKKAIISLVAGCFLASACNPKFYSPDTHNVPLISSKGETELTLAGNTNQVEFQGAYGAGSNFGIKANGSFFIPEDLDNGDGGSGKYFEAGVGYFTPVAGNFVFETYGILGFGDVENHFPSTITANPSTTGDVSANVLRYGIQPAFGYKSPHFSAAISSRIVNLTYSKIEGDLIYGGVTQASYLNDNKSNFLIEPAITLRGGFEKVKLQLQYGHSLNLSNSDFRQDKDYLSIGLNFKLK